MPDKWRTVSIGSLGRVITGKTPSTKDKHNFVGPYPFITIPDLKGEVYIDRSERSLSQIGMKTVSSSLLPAGAVMMSCIATVGKCGITVRPSVTNQQINAVVPNDQVDSRFLYYVFTQIGHQLEASGGGGSVYTNVSKSRFAAIEITIPENIDEQRAITSILGALDDKIELNRKMSATLEAMARAIFTSWFVDFDPVRAKAEGRDTGLAPEIATLFPDAFGNDGGREIPDGWRMGTVADTATLNAEAWTRSTRPEIIKYLDLSTVKWGKIDKPETYAQEDAPSRAQRVLRPGDTIVGTVRPGNGSYALVFDEGFTGSTGFAAFRPTKSKSFTYLAATAKDSIDRLSHLADGAAYPAVRPEVVGASPVVLPPDNVFRAFENVTALLLDRCGQAARESRTLTAIRDALLPKLISGEICVSDAERILEKSA